MSNAETITGRIKLIEREDNSVNGNPRYTLVIELATIEGTPVATGEGVNWRSNLVIVKTASDASISYAINNPEFRDSLVEFTLNGRGMVTYAKPVTE
jgi:hypothetical protein